jgi:lipid-A-disaccharide synthase
VEPERKSRAWARRRVEALVVEAVAQALTGAMALLASPVTAPGWRWRIRDLIASGGESPRPVSLDGLMRESRARLFLIAGEPSGDQRAADLVRAIRDLAPDVRFEGLGGARMAEAGVRLHRRMDEAVMGFGGVIGQAGHFASLLVETLTRLRRDPPDGLILVDYPGFNLRLARAARPLRIPTIQYVAPQVWAWAPWRLPTIAKSVDLILSILPFERRLFEGARTRVVFTGHPLVDRLEAENIEPWREEGEWIGLMPGSRPDEVRRLLPLMLKTAAHLARLRPGARFVVPAASAEIAGIIEPLASAAPVPVEVVSDEVHAVMASLRSALVASGTATLELALLRVPMVVVYPISRMQRLLRRFMLISPHFALANVAAGRAIVEEHLVGRGSAWAPRLAESLARLSRDGSERAGCIAALESVRDRLGGHGAADRAARAVLALQAMSERA